MLWRLTNPNLPGWVDTPATSTPRGSNRAWKPGRVDRHQPTSTSASTATGRPSTTISGLRSALTIDGSALGGLATGRRARRPGPRGRRRGSPRTSPRSRWVARSSIMSRASCARDGHEPERDVRQRLGEDPADAEHHGHPELLVAVQAGDELAVAAEHRRHEQVHLAVLGPGGGEELRGGRRDRVVVAEPEAHEAALGLVRDGRAAELHHDRVAELPRRGHRLGGVVTCALVGEAHAVRRQEPLRVGLGQGGHGRVR